MFIRKPVRQKPMPDSRAPREILKFRNACDSHERLLFIFLRGADVASFLGTQRILPPPCETIASFSRAPYSRFVRHEFVSWTAQCTANRPYSVSHILAYTYTYVFVRTYLCIFVYIYIHTRIYVKTHISVNTTPSKRNAEFRYRVGTTRSL